MAFLVLSISQIFHAFNVQSNTISIFSKQNQFNKFIPILSFAALLIIILMLVIGVFGGQNAAEVVGIYPITPIAFVIAFALALSIIPFIEGYKFIVRKISK
jgi:Ca2+-transporting ATPase